jgi:CxxC-x17-CxxC domain-containing protein
MGRFQQSRESRGGYGSGRRSREGRPNFRDRDSSSFDRGRRRVEVHDVICDKCGKECDVPFKPTGNKPVLCRDCFRKSGPGSDNNSRSNSSSGTGISQDQYKEINAKLDKILGILEMIEFEDDEGEEEDDSEDDEDEEEGSD